MNMKKHIDIRDIVDKLTLMMFKLSGKNEKVKNYIMKSMCKAFEKTNFDYVSYIKRPKRASQLVINTVLNNCEDKVAIVIQGPIRDEDDFTIETIKLYKKMYPKIDIIISTWIDISEKQLEKIKKLDVHLVINEKPIYSGLGNMNYQIISSREGIKMARSLGCSYVLKMRSDQRIYKDNFIELFLGLIEQFPISDKNKKIKQIKRLIMFQGTVGGSMFIPYFLADFLFFGYIEDMEKLFDVKLDKLNMTSSDREKWLDEMIGEINVGDYYKKTAPEIKIIENYIENNSSIKLCFTVEQYWQFVKDYLITVGWDDIDLYWPKYGVYEENRKKHTYETKDSSDRYLRYNWNFSNWFCLYSDKLKYSKEVEKYKENIYVDVY